MNPLDFAKKSTSESSPTKKSSITPLQYASKEKSQPKPKTVTNTQKPTFDSTTTIDTTLNQAIKETAPVIKEEKKKNIFLQYGDWFREKVVEPATVPWRNYLKDVEETTAQRIAQGQDVNGFKGLLKSALPYTKEEAGYAGTLLKEGGKNVPKGFYDFMITTVPKSTAQVFSATLENIDTEGSPTLEKVFSKGAEFFDNAVNTYEQREQARMEELGITPDMSAFDPRKFGYSIGSGGGSMALALATGGASRSTVVAGTVLGLIEGSGTYKEAKAKLREDNPQLSEDQIERRAFALMAGESAGIAALEKVGLDMLFRTGGSFVRQRAINAVTETMQESGQTVWSNMVAKYGYDDERDLSEGLLDTLITTPFIGMFGGSGAQLIKEPTEAVVSTPGVSSGIVPLEPINDPVPLKPAKKEVVETVAKKMNIEKLDAEQLLGIALPVYDTFVNTALKNGQIYQEAEQSAASIANQANEIYQLEGRDAMEEFVNEIAPALTAFDMKPADIIEDVVNDADQADIIASSIKNEPIVAPQKAVTVEEQLAKAFKETMGEATDQDTAKVVEKAPRANKNEGKIKVAGEYVTAQTYSERVLNQGGRLKKVKNPKGEVVYTVIDNNGKSVEIDEKTYIYAQSYKRSLEKKGVYKEPERGLQKKEDRKLYHGTDQEFEDFDIKKSRKTTLYGEGIYFSDNRKLAEYYSTIKTTAADIKNASIEELATFKTRIGTVKEMIAANDAKIKKLRDNPTEKDIAQAKEEGFDGVEFKDTVVKEDWDFRLLGEVPKGGNVIIVFNPSVLKKPEKVVDLEKEISSLENKLGETYQALGDGSIEGISKAQEVLEQIAVEMEISEPGTRGFMGYGADRQVVGIASTFPKWVPEGLRSSKLFDSVLSGLDISNIQYPKGGKVRQRALYQAIFDMLDERLGVDTSDIRNNIINIYEQQQENKGIEESDGGSTRGGEREQVEIPRFERKDNTLFQEAKKYGSAEEFIESLKLTEQSSSNDKIASLANNVGVENFGDRGVFQLPQIETNPEAVKSWETKISNGERPIIYAGSQNGFPRLIDGNNRLQAYKNLGFTEVPVVQPTQLEQIWKEANTQSADIPRFERINKIDSKEFREWFGDSKIVDKEGNPLPVYHGTSSIFSTFDASRIGSRDSGWFGKGFYFALGKGEASYYGQVVMKAYLKINNPFNFGSFKHPDFGGYSFADTYYISKISDVVKALEDKVTLEFAPEKGDASTDFKRKYQKITLEEYKELVNKENLTSKAYDFGDDSKWYKYTDIFGDEQWWRSYQKDEIDQSLLKHVLFDEKYKVRHDFSGMYGVERYIANTMGDSFTEELKKLGYDGTMQSEDGDEYVAFYPEQIRIAEENVNLPQNTPLFERKGGAIPQSGADGMYIDFYNEYLSDEEKETVMLLRELTYTPNEKDIENLASINQKLAIYDEEQMNSKTTALFERVSSTVLNELKGKEFVSKQFIFDLAQQQKIKQGERDVVIESLLEFPDGKINVPDFLATMQGKLVDLTVIEETKDPIYYNIALKEDERGKVRTYAEKVYESDVETKAGKVHFSRNGEYPKKYFGHTRIEDMADGETRRVIEVQSDLFQKGRLELEAPLTWFEALTVELKREYEDILSDFSDGKISDNKKVRAKEIEAEGERLMLEGQKIVKKLEPYRNTFWERMIREEIKKASDDKKSVLLFPTGETAMKIEQLGVSPENFMYEDVLGNVPLGDLRVTKDNITVGRRISDISRNDWIVTKVLGDGRFKVVYKSLFDSAYSDISFDTVLDKISYIENQSPETLSINEETFDISGKVDTENPIFKFYEKDVNKYLRKIKQVDKYTDENNVTWWKIAINEEDKAPVLAFEKKRSEIIAAFKKFKSDTISVETTQNIINEMAERFNIAIPVAFVDSIITPEGLVNDVRGAYFNDAIFFEKDSITATTPFHELVHFFDLHWNKIGVFKGFSKKQIFEALNNGPLPKDPTARLETMEILREKLALQGEQYFAKQEMSGIPEVIRMWFERVRIIMNRLLNMIADRRSTAEDMFRIMYYARKERESVLEFKAGHLASLLLRYQGNRKIADFRIANSFAEFQKQPKKLLYNEVPELMLENNLIDAPMFKKMKEATDEFKSDDERITFIKKDINVIDEIFAQTRDIYLKDKNTFRLADQIQHIGDLSRMEKAKLDDTIAKMLEPYMRLPKILGKGRKEAYKNVDLVLFQGDKDVQNYSEDQLKRRGLNEAEIAAYQSVRRAFDIAYDMMLAKMEERGTPPEELAEYKKQKAGYLPHVWPYEYNVKEYDLSDRARKDEVSTKDIIDMIKGGKTIEEIQEQGLIRIGQKTSYKSKSQAQAVAAKLLNEGVIAASDRDVSLKVDFFSEQYVSLEKMKNILSEAKVGQDVKDKMTDAMRDMFKEKGFGRRYIQRYNVQGYQKEELGSVIADYFSGFTGYITKIDRGIGYYNVLSGVPQRKQPRLYNYFVDLISYDMGASDGRNYFKTFAYVMMLANDIGYLALNATQNLVVGAGEFSKLLKGYKKVFAPEALIIKAQADWAIQNISDIEKQTIQTLIGLGRLGGETTAEQMGFKNNPLYNNISWGLTKAVYWSTAAVERHINRIPAFLAAFRVILSENGGDVGAAMQQALDFSDDIHFRSGKHNRPKFLRGQIAQTLLVFLNYSRSFFYMISRDIKQKEFLALSRKMWWTAVLGGVSSLPFYGLYTVLQSLVADGDDDEELKEELSRWDILFKKGAPAALAQIDLSGRVGLEFMNINQVIENPGDLKSYLGAVGGLLLPNWQNVDEAGRFWKALELFTQGRTIEGFGGLLPDMFANPIKGWIGYEQGVTSFAGTPLEDADGQLLQYNAYEAIIKALGFTPTRESLIWDEKKKEYRNADNVTERRTSVRRTIMGQLKRGEYDEARLTQESAIREGIISEKTDYIKEYGMDTFLKDTYQEWEKSNKTTAVKQRIEKELTQLVYGESASDAEKNAIRKEVEVLTTYGYRNKTVMDYEKSNSNADKVDFLFKARSEMTPEEFKDFYEKGRDTYRLENGKKSPILISNAVDKAWNESKDSFRDDAEVTDAKSVVDKVATYAEAIGTDPVTAFNRIFTGQSIRRVDNGTIIVERMPLEASEKVKEEWNGNSEELKLDHTIPLTLGGSNSTKNLKLVPTNEWKKYTPIETYLGKLLRNEVITKKEAQDLIIQFKNGEIKEADIYKLK